MEKRANLVISSEVWPTCPHMIQRRDKLASPLLTFPNQNSVYSRSCPKTTQLKNKQGQDNFNVIHAKMFPTIQKLA